MLLTAPDSLVVSITKHHSLNGDEQHNTASLVSTPRRSRESFGIDGLDLLKFTYKVHFSYKHTLIYVFIRIFPLL